MTRQICVSLAEPEKQIIELPSAATIEPSTIRGLLSSTCRCYLEKRDLPQVVSIS